MTARQLMKLLKQVPPETEIVYMGYYAKSKSWDLGKINPQVKLMGKKKYNEYACSWNNWGTRQTLDAESPEHVLVLKHW